MLTQETSIVELRLMQSADLMHIGPKEVEAIDRSPFYGIQVFTLYGSILIDHVALTSHKTTMTISKLSSRLTSERHLFPGISVISFLSQAHSS